MQPMESKQWTTVDKTGWEAGPWHSEPDKMQWQDEATGLPCLIVRNPGGALCGYVGVGMRHPDFGKHYDEPDVSTHGGLTFAGECMNTDDESKGICHVHPGSGKVWWFGFDCAHCGDVSPKYDMMLGALRHEWKSEDTYKDVAYVQREVGLLAAQLRMREVEGLRQAWTTFRNIVSYPYTFVANTRLVQRGRRRIVFWRMRRALPKIQAATEALRKERASGRA